MVAPLGEKASPLENKAPGASKDWSLGPLELKQALLELLHATLQLIWDPLEFPKAPMHYGLGVIVKEFEMFESK